MSSNAKPLAINLLPQDPFLESPAGRVLQWSTGAGRYIIIFTLIVVILSFGARFTLDRQVTDLNEKLYKQIRTLEGMAADESAYRLAQAQIGEVKKNQEVSNILDVFAALNKVVPADVTLDSLMITPTGISIEGIARSEASFITFITNLQLTPQFSSIKISKVQSMTNQQPGLYFSLTAATQPVPQLTVARPKSTPASAAKTLEAPTDEQTIH